MYHHKFNFRDCLRASERTNWRVEDVIGNRRQLDFDRTFLPEVFVRENSLDFLDGREKLLLNQIRGYSYFMTFSLLKEFVVPFVIDQARSVVHDDDVRTRALLGFASEEARHIHLIKTFRDAFRRDFAGKCAAFGAPADIAKKVLAHHPLAVALVILQIEWMTQAHYVESVKEERELDPMFKGLLKHHWLKESQHAKMDTLLIDALLAEHHAAGVRQGLSDYFAIIELLDKVFMQQVSLDCISFQTVVGRDFSDAEYQALTAVQSAAARYTFIGAGLQHPNFLAVVKGISPAARQQIDEMTPAYC